MGKFSALSKEILIAASEELEVSLVSQRCQRVLAQEGFAGIRKIVRADRVRHAKERMKTLERRGLIKVAKIGKSLTVALTSSGYEKFLRLHIKEANSYPGTISTLVSYDIPEHTRDSRDVFRRFLKSTGFKKIHDSLWISNSDCYDILDSWIVKSKFEKWITVFKVIEKK